MTFFLRATFLRAFFLATLRFLATLFLATFFFLRTTFFLAAFFLVVFFFFLFMTMFVYPPPLGFTPGAQASAWAPFSTSSAALPITASRSNGLRR